MSFKPEDFSLDTLQRCFKECLSKHADNQVDIDLYLRGYEEIYKFLCLLGTVFGWVASDVMDKIDKIRRFRENPDLAAKYVSVGSMIEYELNEVKTVKVKKADDGTGTRYLIRIHRALEYVSMFLAKMSEKELHEKCGPASQDAYKSTMLKYHPWVVQKGALMASHMLPTKEGLIWKICPPGDQSRFEDTLKRLPDLVNDMKNVYESTENIYRKHNLTDLP